MPIIQNMQAYANKGLLVPIYLMCSLKRAHRHSPVCPTYHVSQARQTNLCGFPNSCICPAVAATSDILEQSTHEARGQRTLSVRAGVCTP